MHNETLKAQPLLSSLIPACTFTCVSACKEHNAQEKDVIIRAENLSRRDQRSLIFHFLYAMESYEYAVSFDEILDGFFCGFGLFIDKQHEVVATTLAIIERRNELDTLYIPFLENWRFERISVATKLIVRFAVFELITTTMSTRIIINEAVELAKCFAEEDAFRFINGILDRVACSQGRKEPEVEAATQASVEE